MKDERLNVTSGEGRRTIEGIIEPLVKERVRATLVQRSFILLRNSRSQLS